MARAEISAPENTMIGSPQNRQVLAERLADGMKRAWEATKKEAIAGSDVQWKTESVKLEPASDLDEVSWKTSSGPGTRGLCLQGDLRDWRG